MGAGGAAEAAVGVTAGLTPVGKPSAGVPAVLGPEASKLSGAEAGCPPVPVATSCNSSGGAQ